MIDWCTIEQGLIELQRNLMEIAGTPSLNEMDAHKVYVQLGKPSPIIEGFDVGARLYEGSPTFKTRIDALAAQVSGGNVQISFPAISMPFVEALDLLEERIAARQIDTEFLLMWGATHELAGRILELIGHQEGQKAAFDKNTNSGRTKSTLAQKYWHSYWVRMHASGNGQSRGNVEDNLAELCRSIRQGMRVAPHGFSKEWFATMICQESGQDLEPDKQYNEVMLKTPYTRATPNEIDRMCANRLVDPDDLPPLEFERFPRCKRR